MVSQVIIDRHLYHINATTQEGLKWWLYTKEKLAVPGSDSSPFDEKLFAAMDSGTFWLNLVPSSLLLVIFNPQESFWLLLATRKRTLVLNSTSIGQETSKKVPYTPLLKVWNDLRLKPLGFWLVTIPSATFSQIWTLRADAFSTICKHDFLLLTPFNKVRISKFWVTVVWNVTWNHWANMEWNTTICLKSSSGKN